MPSRKPRIQLSPRLRLGVGRKYSSNTLFKYSGSAFLILSACLFLNTFRIFLNNNARENTIPPQVLGIANSKASEPTANTEQFQTIKVKKGETLFSIAKNYNISWTTLATINNLQSPFSVSNEQELKVPKP